MREIKFRYIFEHRFFNNISIYYFTLNDIEQGQLNKVFTSGMLENGYELIARSLYAGLKEENNKEIYEGDIVDFHGIKIKIEYNEAEGCFWGGSNKQRHILQWADHLKVIGNIFENKELLNEKS